ncbi:MAG TPA: right-handed parallel beta-helix repeat-containing protein [Candidatus Elarobacter sp.]
MNPCSRTAPCKTFAGAVSKTADCGEIDALDPAGYGTITLTKGIKIDGGGGEAGQVASILASGVPGVIINNSSVACPMDVLRNLDINGIASGTIGISVLQGGTLAIENVDVENFTNTCLNVVPSAGLAAVGITIYNSNFERCVNGALVVNYTGAGFERIVASMSKFSKSQTGPGISITGNSKSSFKDSDINNNQGGGVLTSGANVNVHLVKDQVSNNQTFGVHTTNNSTMSLSDTSVVHNNGTGLFADVGTQLLTWNNNWVHGNSPDGARTGTITPM